MVPPWGLPDWVVILLNIGQAGLPDWVVILLNDGQAGTGAGKNFEEFIRYG